jgi:DNA modification methylase
MPKRRPASARPCRLIVGDCVEAMRAIPECSVDAIVCDPPYGLEFMNKEWDRLGASMQVWHEAWAREALRVLKPGGHLLAFGGTRTYHRLAAGIEDAGFEIRDCIAWMYGSGFPKSLDVSKAIDKAAGAERSDGARKWSGGARRGGIMGDNLETQTRVIYDTPVTVEAERWSGWGTSLKPGYEPIVVARKPLSGTVAATVLEHGTGALNIDGCRVGSDGGTRGTQFHPESETGGRWPANVVLSHSEDCVQVGAQHITGDQRQTGNGRRKGGFGDIGADRGDGEPNEPVYGDETVERWACTQKCPVRILDSQTVKLTSGSYTRFFYCAKASAQERSAGLEKLNPHPTIKPIEVMRYLVRLVTPPGGLVLDPFTGSGTTGCAAVLEGFRFYGIEKEEEYADIVRARIRYWYKQALLNSTKGNT